MLAEHLCREADSLIGRERSVGIHIQSQLIKVCHLADTGIVHGHIHPLNRGVNGIHCDHTDRQILALVLLGADIAASLGDGQLHVQLAFLAAAQRGDYEIGIEDFNILVRLDVRGSDYAFTFEFNISGLGFVGLAVVLDRQALDVHDDLGHILLDAGDGTELMQHALNLNLADSSARQ